MTRSATWRLVWLPLLVGVGCQTLPEDHRPPHGRALPPSSEGPFARVETDVRERFGGDASGFLLLDRNREALLWRLALIDSAIHSLDLQY